MRIVPSPHPAANILWQSRTCRRYYKHGHKNRIGPKMVQNREEDIKQRKVPVRALFRSKMSIGEAMIRINIIPRSSSTLTGRR